MSVSEHAAQFSPDEDCRSHNIPWLKAFAKVLGIRGYSRMLKRDLCAAVLNAVVAQREDLGPHLTAQALAAVRRVAGEPEPEEEVEVEAEAQGLPRLVKKLRDTAPITAVALKGNRIVSWSEDARGRVWNATTGGLERTLKQDTVLTFAVAFDGNRIVVPNEDEVWIEVWNATTGELELTLKGHTDAINSVAIGGNRIVSGGDDKTVKVWNATTGELERTLEGHVDQINSVAIDGNRIVSGSHDRSIRVWNASTGELEQTLWGHDDPIWKVFIEGNHIVSGSEGTVKVWNAITGALERTFGIPGLSAFQGNLIVSTSGNEVKVWNATTGALLRTWEGHRQPFLVVSVAIGGDRLVSGSDDKSIRVWDISDLLVEAPEREAAQELPPPLQRFVGTLEGHTGQVNSVAIDGNRIVSGSDDGTVRLWNTTTGALEQTLDEAHDNSIVMSVAIGGNRIVSGGQDETVKVWNATTGALERTLDHGDIVLSVAIDGNQIVSGSQDATVSVWNATTGELKYSLEADFLAQETVGAVAIDGNRIVSGGEEGKEVYVWDATTGEQERTLFGMSDNVMSVAIDGERIVSGGDDGGIYLWNATTGNLEWEDKVPERVFSVAIEGNRVVSGNIDGTVKVWNATTGELERTLVGHTGGVHAVAIDGDRIVSGDDEGKIRIWDISGPPEREAAQEVQAETAQWEELYDALVLRDWDKAESIFQSNRDVIAARSGLLQKVNDGLDVEIGNDTLRWLVERGLNPFQSLINPPSRVEIDQRLRRENPNASDQSISWAVSDEIAKIEAGPNLYTWNNNNWILQNYPTLVLEKLLHDLEGYLLQMLVKGKDMGEICSRIKARLLWKSPSVGSDRNIRDIETYVGNETINVATVIDWPRLMTVKTAIYDLIATLDDVCERPEGFRYTAELSGIQSEDCYDASLSSEGRVLVQFHFITPHQPRKTVCLTLNQILLSFYGGGAGPFKEWYETDLPPSPERFEGDLKLTAWDNVTLVPWLRKKENVGTMGRGTQVGDRHMEFALVSIPGDARPYEFGILRSAWKTLISQLFKRVVAGDKVLHICLYLIGSFRSGNLKGTAQVSEIHAQVDTSVKRVYYPTMCLPPSSKELPPTIEAEPPVVATKVATVSSRKQQLEKQYQELSAQITAAFQKNDQQLIRKLMVERQAIRDQIDSEETEEEESELDRLKKQYSDLSAQITAAFRTGDQQLIRKLMGERQAVQDQISKLE